MRAAPPSHPSSPLGKRLAGLPHQVDSEEGFANGDGGVAVDGSGRVFVTDPFNKRIQKFACQ